MLTREDFERAAKRIGCDVPAVQAVAEVESRGEPFYSDGFPVILFERHKFHKFTKGKFAASNPRVCSPKPGGYSPPKGPGTLTERNESWQRSKFNEAVALDADAALKSCSYGRFQIMGFNHEACGYESVRSFYNAMFNERRQLDAFVEFVISQGLAEYLRNKDWEPFAERYNGPDYKKNNYHVKLPRAYAKYVKLNANSSPVPSPQAATIPSDADAAAQLSSNETSESKTDSDRGSFFDSATGWISDKKNKLASIGVEPGSMSLNSRVIAGVKYVWAFICAAVAYLWNNPWLMFGVIALVIAAGWYVSRSKDRELKKKEMAV